MPYWDIAAGLQLLGQGNGQNRSRRSGRYLKLFALDADQAKPKDDQWTGAEIRACCRLAALLDLPLTAAAQNVVPVAVTAAESVERLRTWASGRCLSADQIGIYNSSSGVQAKPSRKLRRTDPSNN